MRAKDMTSGSPARLLWGFALPLMLGNVCQQLYTIVDAAFVGRFAGIDALAAVGASDWFTWLVMGVIWGYTQGFSVLISQKFGEGDHAALRRTIGVSVLLTALIACALVVVSQCLVGPGLRLLRVPTEIRHHGAVYLRILFAALPVMAAYNIQASILRAVGDAKTPLAAMLLASGVNIALDALFVIVFRWGVAGAAGATVIAQAASALYCFSVLRRTPAVRVEKQDLQWDGTIARRLVSLGTPAAAQNIIIGAGGMVVQRVINSYGKIFLAGFTATNKLYGLIEMAAVSYGGAIAAYAGQNFGARKMERIRQGIRAGAAMSVATALAIAAVLFPIGRIAVSLFVDPLDPQVDQVLSIALQYLHVMLIGLFLLYLLYVYRSALQGMGDTFTPMVSGLVELAMRVGSALVLPRFLGEFGLYLTEPAAWGGAALLLSLTYYRKMRKLSLKEDR